MERVAERPSRAVRRVLADEPDVRPRRDSVASSLSSASGCSADCNLAPMLLKKDLTSTPVAPAESAAVLAAFAPWAFPKYQRASPIARTAPAVPSMSGKRSMSG